MANIEQKIAKLLRLAEDSGATEAEAALAAEKAQALMLEHGIELAQIQMDGGESLQVEHMEFEGERLDPWRRLAFAGPTGTVGGMVKLYRYLDNTLDDLSRLAAAEHANRWGWKGDSAGARAAESMRWRRSWLYGAAYRIADRLRERIPNDGSTGQALVVLKSALDKSLEDRYGDLREERTTGPESVDHYAFGRGAETGSNVPLLDDELERERRAREIQERAS
jgi:hypothetical protein